MGDIAELREAFLVGSVEPNYIALRERPNFFRSPREGAVDDLDFAACWCFSCDVHFVVLVFGFWFG